MLENALTKVFGSRHDREVKKMLPMVAAVGDIEPRMKELSDAQLTALTASFKERLDQGSSKDDLLVEAFAAAREAAWRTIGQRPYDVQLMGGMVLHRGIIAEMKTGEGKTLMSTLAAYLNALDGKGVHVVTVNDYLARRDADWMGTIFRFMGYDVGCIQSNISEVERSAAYRADITYATNNELGFDYLRDNMKFDLASMVQRGHNFAIVDEVDSILIDEARTPLIISGPSEESVDKYYRIDRLIPQLERGEEVEEGDTKYTTGHFLVDEKAHTVTLTEDGVGKVEKIAGVENLYDLENMDLLHGINQGLRAHNLFKKDVDYLIKDGQVVIVDEFTGRMMAGRRWSDGLHQAVEAKEGVRIERENQTLATITFQNYFRMYDKLGGMTGTADTEASEFAQIYELDVSVIPTNRPMVRDDRGDLVYRTEREKWDAVVDEIADCHDRGQPVLVGTISIESSEMLAKRLKPRGVPHHVLNAKYHEKEASIIAQAGRKGAVTIATNMAGRGTDIVLGGNPEGLARAEIDPEEDAEAYAEAVERYTEACAEEKSEVLEAGGLHILGTERHESRRIDNQLRGRSGRQGDPGSSRFFLSLEDDLMRIFGSERVQGLIGRLGLEEGEPIEANMVSKAIERAQKQVEGRNFEVRKHLLEYDDVMNKQREAIYQLRKDVLDGTEGRDYLNKISRDVIEYILATHCPDKSDPEEWNLTEVSTDILAYFDIATAELDPPLDQLGVEELEEHLVEAFETKYAAKVERLGDDLMKVMERDVMLRVVDHAWKDHLLALDHLKEGIGLRGYGQKNPLQEYKRESFELLESMKERVEDTIIRTLFRLEPASEEQLAERRALRGAGSRMQFGPPKTAATPQKPHTVERKGEKVGRNDPCPCGSGKKYKKCHGAVDKVVQ